jgi:hypothetical protein
VAGYWLFGYQWVATIEERFCMEQWPKAFLEYKKNVAKHFMFF